jgi:hypothetical protein
VSALDGKIDRLYQLALDEFTAARNTLAKSLTGSDAAAVKKLVKPTVVPWAVNQVYWRARPVYDRVLKSGEKLRAAQIASLEGRKADVAAASDAHRRAIGDAVREAGRLTAGAKARPDADTLSRTFEALSLRPTPAEPHGRFTSELQPAGLEALAGIAVRLKPDTTTADTTTAVRLKPDTTDHAAQVRGVRLQADRQRQADLRRHAEIKSAEDALVLAEAAEAEARKTWERAHDTLLAARKALTDLKSVKSQV